MVRLTSCAGRRFGSREFLLPLAERLLGATAPPVTRDRRPLRIHFTVFADVGPKVVHDRLRFAVDEGVHLAGKPRGGLDRFDQRRVVAGSVLADQIGSPAAINPIDLNTVRRGQRDFVLGLGNLDEHLANCVGGQRFQRNADGRQRGLVAGQQMPVGRRIRCVGATGAHQVDRLAGLGRCGPLSGRAVLAVHDDVDGDLAGGRVGTSHGQRPHHRLLGGRQVGETVQRQRSGQARPHRRHRRRIPA